MSFLRPSALYQLLMNYHSFRWMPCNSRAILRWPSLGGLLRMLIVVLLWSLSAEIWYITSSSMYPALAIGDRLITEKASYIIRCPAIHDIVFFRAPSQQPGFRKDEILVKRIVARAGDSVEVHHGWLFVNGVSQKEDFIVERPTYETELTYVPKEHVYVLGDNRNNSCDSHVWGPLPVKDIVGRYVMRLYRPSTI